MMFGANGPLGQARISAAVRLHGVNYLARVNPLLAAGFPVAFLYAQNMAEVPFLTAAATMLAVLVGTAVFMSVVWLVLRNDAASGFLAVTWLLLFFSYGHIFDLTTGASIGGFVFGRYRYVLAAEIIIAILALLVAVRARNFCHLMTPSITVALLIPFVFTWGALGVFHLRGSPGEIAGADAFQSIRLPLLQGDQLPDIYYIILDSYPRQDVLQSIYGFDNSQFLDHLAGTDFFIASDSRTNYMQTALSLSSSLNMDYLQTLIGKEQRGSNNPVILRRMVQDNKAALLAKRMGYQFAFLRSNYSITLSNPHADARLSRLDYPLGTFGRLVLQPVLGNEFSYFFTRTTLLRNAVDQGFVYFAADLFSSKIEQLKRISEVEGPTFTFAHFAPPHPPYVFDREGNVLGVGFALQPNYDRQSYVDQLIWVNKSISGAVDYILENNKTGSVIVIQGDHGTEITDTRKVVAYGGDPDDTLIHERSSILNVYHLPEMCKPGNLYKSISPVNTFRVIFDSCWGTEFGLLEDESYWSTYDRTFDFTPIEDVVRYTADPP